MHETAVVSGPPDLSKYRCSVVGGDPALRAQLWRTAMIGEAWLDAEDEEMRSTAERHLRILGQCMACALVYTTCVFLPLYLLWPAIP